MEPVYVAEVVSKKGFCYAGHQIGDSFEVNGHKTGGICGRCYYDLYPILMTLVCDGKVPWIEEDMFVYECPDKANLVEWSVKKQV